MSGEGGSFSLPRLGWRAFAAGALALAVIVVVVVARLRGDGDSSPPRVPGALAATGSAAATASPLPDDSVEGAGSAPYGQAASPGALDAATQFVHAWAAHPAGITAQRWAAAVAKHADPVLREQLATTDPRLVPATRVTGTAESIAGGVSSATVAVPTDAGKVIVTCTLVGGRWLVSDLDIERGPR